MSLKDVHADYLKYDLGKWGIYIKIVFNDEKLKEHHIMSLSLTFRF